MPEQGGLCASAEDGQNAALDRVQKRVWLAGIGARLPQIRESGTLKLRGWRGHFRTVSVQCPWGSWHVRWGLVAGLALVEV